MSRALATGLAALLALTAAGCSSGPTNVPTPPAFSADGADPTADATGQVPLEDATADQIVERVTAAVDSAGPVHLTGTYTEPPPVGRDGRPVEDPVPALRTLRIDVHGTPSRFTASFRSAGTSARIVRDGDHVYARGDQVFADSLGEPAAAAGWVRFDATDPALAPWLTFTDVPALVASIFEPRPDVSVAKGSTTTTPVPGLQVEVSSRGTLTGTMVIATKGPPVPLSIAVTDPTGTGDLRFTEWEEPVKIDMPDIFTTSGEA